MAVRTLFPLLLISAVFWHTSHAQQIDRSSWPVQAERSRTFDVLHYRIELDLDDQNKRLDGTVTIRLSSLNDNLTHCSFDAERITVTRAMNGDGIPLDISQEKGTVAVTLSRAYQYGDTLDIILEYVKQQTPLDASIYGMQSSYQIGLTFLDETTDHPALIQTIGFPTGARHWYPCYDHPNDKATQEVIATVREDYQVLSNGTLIGVKHNPDERTRTFHWYQTKPHSTYLSIVFAGPYIVLRDSLGSLPVNYWVYPRDVANAMRSFHRTPEILRFFEVLYGVPYPWEKYDQITIPGIGGGQENTSATSLGQSTIHDQKAEKDFPSHWLVAHEAAHQWWGDLVTLRDWSHTWINESFATYGEYLYSRHSRGDNEGALNLEEKKNSYLAEARERYIRSIVSSQWNFPNDNFDRHTYQKGASVLHMLRHLLGDDAFFRVHTHFLRKHAFQSADTHDFQIAIREVTGQNIDWFFDQWIYRPGHPIFDVSYRWEETRRELLIRVDQRQDISQGISVFRVPVSIGVTTKDGKTSHSIWIEKKTEEIRVPCAGPPLLVRFDEGNVLLKELHFPKETSELLYQLEHDDVIGRMWAADQLKGIELGEEIIHSLQNTARSDEFWGVRQHAVEALRGTGKQTFSDFYKQMCLDPHSSVRVSALGALGDLRDPSLVSFFRERFDQEDSYRAQAEALRAIGKSGDVTIREFLKRASETPSPRSVIQAAANWSLQELDRK